MGNLNEVQRELRYFFNEWELGFCVLISLFLQILLILAGPLRKRVSHKGLDILLWSAYLLADATAIFAVGLIASKQAAYSNHYLNAPPNSILHTFWAPFLLAHLGGPDPITAFALEDNELWLRHLFSLFTQCIAVAYVFYQSLTPNKLLLPSLLIFLCGIIKYAERTYALYCASTKTFRDSILNEPEHRSEIWGKYIPEKDSTFPVITEDEDNEMNADLKPLEVVQYAFLYFINFKGLVVDLVFSYDEYYDSKSFFFARTWRDAFRVVEVELNFFYDILFSKLPVVYYRVGFGCRAVSVGAIVTSLVIFHYVDKKQFKAEGFEVGITYILLIGGIVLEVIAFLMLVFSDWTVVKLEPRPDKNPDEQSWKRMFMDFIVSGNDRRGKTISWLLNIGGARDSINDSVSELTDSRWAESISGYNFIYYSLHRRSKAKEKIYDQLGIRAFLDEIIYKRRHPLPSYIKDFIFNELKMKSDKIVNLGTAKRLCSAKGEWVLEKEGYRSSGLFPFVADVEYDESILLWHIATEICYKSKEDQIILREQGHTNISKHHRKIAKLISDYMMYLLVMKPGMMSTISRKVVIRFRETCDNAKDIFDQEISKGEKLEVSRAELEEIACKRFYDFLLSGGEGASLLFEAAELAKELQKIECKDRWKITSKVWVEMLSYGASHIKSSAHAQQLTKGGEFVTTVWLLMTHLGLVDQFNGPPQIMDDFIRRMHMISWEISKACIKSGTMVDSVRAHLSQQKIIYILGAFVTPISVVTDSSEHWVGLGYR